MIFEENKYKIVGLLHGGPASPIHYYISKILSNTTSPPLNDIESLIEYFRKKFHSVDTEELRMNIRTQVIFLDSIRENILKSSVLEGLEKEFLIQLYSKALEF